MIIYFDRVISSKKYFVKLPSCPGWQTSRVYRTAACCVTAAVTRNNPNEMQRRFQNHKFFSRFLIGLSNSLNLVQLRRIHSSDLKCLLFKLCVRMVMLTIYSNNVDIICLVVFFKYLDNHFFFSVLLLCVVCVLCIHSV